MTDAQVYSESTGQRLNETALQFLQGLAYLVVFVGLAVYQYATHRAQKRSNERLSSKVADVNDAVAAVPAQVDQKIANVSDKLSTPIGELQASLSILTNSLSAIQSSQQATADENRALRMDNHNIKNLYDDSLKDKARLVESLNNLQSELQNYRQQIAGLLQWQTDTKTDLLDMSGTLNALRSSLAEAQTEIKALKLENSESREALVKSNAAYQDEAEKVKVLQTELAEARRCVDEVQTQLTDLQAKFDDYRKQKHDERDRLHVRLQGLEYAVRNAVNILTNGTRAAFIEQMRADGVDLADLLSSKTPSLITAAAQQGIT